MRTLTDKIKLYHFTDEELQRIDVDRFGAHAYTSNDQKAAGVRRSFFYLEDNPAEFCFKSSKYCYVVELPPFCLYDLRTDKKGLIPKSKRAGLDIVDVNRLLWTIRRRGYIGAIYSVGGIDIAILFKNIRPAYIVDRTEQIKKGI